MVRYYGHDSNVARGKRKKQDQDGLIPSILEPDKKNFTQLVVENHHDCISDTLLSYFEGGLPKAGAS